LKRLQILPAPTHISSLICSTQSNTSARVALCYFFLYCVAISGGFGNDRTSGGLVRELYRGYVRSFPLGSDDNIATLLGKPIYLSSISFRFNNTWLDAAHADTCPPLLFLTDLYTHSLLTMASSSPASARGPDPIPRSTRPRWTRSRLHRASS